jgi:hypothetical protein
MVAIMFAVLSFTSLKLFYGEYVIVAFDNAAHTHIATKDEAETSVLGPGSDKTGTTGPASADQKTTVMGPGAAAAAAAADKAGVKGPG